MSIKNVTSIKFNVNDTDGYDVKRCGNEKYIHTWELDAEVNGVETSCKHTIIYSKEDGVLDSVIIDTGDNKTLLIASKEIAENVKELTEKAEVNIKYFIDNIDKN